MRILIADTDENFLKDAQRRLFERGHDACTATNGLQCMASLRCSAPDALVMARGLLWGGCDGVLAAMQDDLLLTNLPVVLLTAGSGDEFNSPAFPNIAVRLRMPLPLDELLEVVLFAARTDRTAVIGSETN